MSNIPLINQNRISGSSLPRRTNKVIASKSTNDKTPAIKRRLERRQNLDRRQKKIKVLFDRRLRGIHRRKLLSNKQETADTIGLSETKGKHINTTA
ncbi:MAG: hypothetical protein DIZ80_08860 [endosymbiont of Galathealinum brachiosum]|uniref:Uncharacterized protein n=1 Tax=endosymbiont of Galathealinum brachiosum TaxID=2200906 RepID=A0A370DBY3_9GAMM|nr:MAG: hypothetical protein DIZ80_08860 [endosymbiont of Galathealinum brachiosum]